MPSRSAVDEDIQAVDGEVQHADALSRRAGYAADDKELEGVERENLKRVGMSPSPDLFRFLSPARGRG